MPVYFYFRFAPFPTMVGLRIHGTFENETGEFKFKDKISQTGISPTSIRPF